MEIFSVSGGCTVEEHSPCYSKVEGLNLTTTDTEKVNGKNTIYSGSILVEHSPSNLKAEALNLKLRM
jgi:hypothetical protein